VTNAPVAAPLQATDAACDEATGACLMRQLPQLSGEGRCRCRDHVRKSGMSSCYRVWAAGCPSVRNKRRSWKF